MAFSGTRRLKALLLRPEPLFRAYLKWKFGAGALTERPAPTRSNGTLKNRAEWEESLRVARRLHLPLHREPTKNWDHGAAIATILANTTPEANILDAGAELYSNILPALFLYGYRNLYGINLDFKFASRRGPIRYLIGDLTRLPFPNDFFEAITCMSVIEHGVPLDAYFREMRRVLKPKGLLITSTDYYPTPIDAAGKSAHGSPIRIFTKQDIERVLALANSIGFDLTGPIDLDADERPITWEEYGLSYTFLLFTLRKR
jgi:SAM-dependent methyltransferase